MVQTLQHGLLLLGTEVSNQKSPPSGGLEPFAPLLPRPVGPRQSWEVVVCQGPLGDGFRALGHPEWPWGVDRKTVEGSLHPPPFV